jgi:acyl-CoA reductase-like NAD-dependent aldehyde dehydrogenase
MTTTLERTKLTSSTFRLVEKVSGSARGKLLIKLADLMEQNADELASLESLDNGKAFSVRPVPSLLLLLVLN